MDEKTTNNVDVERNERFVRWEESKEETAKDCKGTYEIKLLSGMEIFY
jgi:hypothetical protein